MIRRNFARSPLTIIYQVFFQGGGWYVEQTWTSQLVRPPVGMLNKLGHPNVGMSKFVQHTNWGSYKLGCPSLFNIPTTSLKKNLINYSQGGARKISSYHSGALTIALLSWPSFHQDIFEKTSWPSFHQDILEKTVC